MVRSVRLVNAVEFMNGVITRPVGTENIGSLGLTSIRTGRANIRVVTATDRVLVMNCGRIGLTYVPRALVNSMTLSIVV